MHCRAGGRGVACEGGCVEVELAALVAEDGAAPGEREIVV